MADEGAFLPDPLAAQNIDDWLHRHRGKSLLRFLTCGSVDDGKSTLIGRLLYDSRTLFTDQLDQLEQDSRRVGTQKDGIDFALLVDGLSIEREQGITIDVAYRFFATDTRKFIVADAPGHEQYTRNMVTAASTADAAIILVDARQGILTQTRRHSYLAHLLGVRHLILAVTKMDLVGYDEAVFRRIHEEYRSFAAGIGIAGFLAVPVSGLRGDNVISRSDHMPWHGGPTLIQALERIEVDEENGGTRPFRMPVQLVQRPNPDFRGFCGLIASGRIASGDAVRIMPSGLETRVARIVDMEGDREEAAAGESVTLTLTGEIDCARGDMIVAAAAPTQVADQFAATLVWLSEDPLVPGREYALKIGTRTVSATIRPPRHIVNVNNMEQLAAKTLELNAIGEAELATAAPIPFEPYETDRTLGGFILVDRESCATVAAGMIRFALRRSQNLHWQKIHVTREVRARLKQQKPGVLWLTGLSGAGKSTIANLVEKKLAARLRHTFLLDGDNVRHGLNKDLGFTEADRVENVRRIGEVARLMADAGLIVIAAFISPFRAEREMVRRMLPPGEFIEIFVDTPLPEAERRDTKGLYAKARAGELHNFTGIDSPYEPPETPEIRIDTTAMTAEEAADLIVDFLERQD